MTSWAPANWYPDPSGKHELRYWDGAQWTPHVISDGRPEVDPLAGAAPSMRVGRSSKKAQRAVRRAGVHGDVQGAGGSLLTESVLVVSQKAKIIEVNAEYSVYDQYGRQLGAVREVGQTLMKKAVAESAHVSRSHRLEIVDLGGRVLITLTRPAKLFRSKMIVRDPSGVEIGQIGQKNFGSIGKGRFALESDGRTLGSINAENWNAWDFSIQDATGREIARINKTWAGLTKEMFTKGDTYVVQVQQPLDEPLRSLVISAALAVDTALRQGNH